MLITASTYHNSKVWQIRTAWIAVGKSLLDQGLFQVKDTIFGGASGNWLQETTQSFLPGLTPSHVVRKQ